jgi:hypothetical protein
MEFSGEDFSESLEETLDPVLGETEKPNKGGRPTIPDNILLGSRNQWRSFFEQCWHEIGWPLLQIPKRRNSTLEDVQKVLRGVEGKLHCDHARMFLRGEPQETTVVTLRNQRIASSNLRFELQDMQRAHPELERACAEAQSAVEQADENYKIPIQLEAAHRRKVSNRHARKIKARETKCLALECTIRNQETYLYCSELLDFLRSGRYALNPISLANALAGLPDMRWRRSVERCSKMPADEGTQHPYAVFLLIDRLIRRIGARRAKFAVYSFQMELMKLPKKERYPRDFLCNQWRDFRLAVEEVCKTKHERGFVPYVMTSAFLRNVARQKTSVDSVLDAEEKLTPN